MGWTIRIFCVWGLLLCAAFAVLGGEEPAAGVETPCFAQFDRAVSASELLSAKVAWTCSGTPDAGSHSVALRFAISPDHPAPRYIYTRLGDFERLVLHVRTRAGAWHTTSLALEDTLPTGTGPYLLAPLPQTDVAIDRLIARFDAPGHASTLLFARPVAAGPSETLEARKSLLLVAVLFGAMLIPVIFDLAFYRTLREKFIIWHGALAASFAILVALRSGLVHEFAPLDPAAWRIALIMGFGISVCTAAMFTRNFIEPGMLHPRLHRLLMPAAIWALAISVLHALSLPILRPLGGNLHTIGLLPVLALFLATLGNAFFRGSRGVRFQVLGWLPLVLALGIQVATNLLPIGLPTDALPLFYVGVLCETVATAIGVADRFLIVRHARDNFEARVNVLRGLAQRDPLTGLLNRRAVEPRFAELRAEGFDTFALLDLDQFKAVNDRHGHSMGDRVLSVAAAALAGDEDALAIRLGGEEFLLFLRGPQAKERAEQRRRAIPARVAHEISGLAAPVTASMGLIEVPRDALGELGFEDFYRSADRLLYEAKSNGRNRTVSERFTTFAGAAQDRRRAPEAASDRRNAPGAAA